jgi:8-oxo-dGTP pyrophosphatase MutT (NUDIX family)
MSDYDNPWKTLSTEEVYDNPWIRITENKVINAAGNPGIYGKISFKNLACGIIPIDENGDTWIVGQFRYPLSEYSWEIPMGGVPIGTDLLSGAKRELKEETGLTAKKWDQILRVHISNSITDEVGYVFVAEDLEHGEPEFEETEKIEIRKLPFNDLVKMVAEEEITDGLSVAGILRLATRRQAGGL